MCDQPHTCRVSRPTTLSRAAKAVTQKAQSHTPQAGPNPSTRSHRHLHQLAAGTAWPLADRKVHAHAQLQAKQLSTAAQGRTAWLRTDACQGTKWGALTAAQAIRAAESAITVQQEAMQDRRAHTHTHVRPARRAYIRASRPKGSTPYNTYTPTIPALAQMCDAVCSPFAVE